MRSLRVLRRHWKLTAIAIFSLSMAMALGVLSLSIANTFLFLKPAAQEPDRLITISMRNDKGEIEQLTYPEFEYYKQNSHSFTDVAAAPNSISLYVDNDFTKHALRILARPVSGNYLSVMGIRPYLGRLLSPEDDRSTADVAVMTWQCWNRLGADRNMIGKVIAGHTILGITPKTFTGSFYGLNGDLLITFRHVDKKAPEPRELILTARLKPGVTRQEAQAEMATLSRRLGIAYPKENKNRTAIVRRATLLPPDGIATAELIIGILIGVVLLVLLIACANAANLLLAIAVGRRQETSIKLALGASRARLIREFLTESALLCVTAGVIGYGIAALVIAQYSGATFTLPLYGAFSLGLNLHLDMTVAALTVALVLIAGAATGLPPALYGSSPHISQVLNGEIVVGGTGKNLRRSALLVAQIAICTVVLIGMGLCQRSLYNLRHVDTGFLARNLIAVQVYVQGLGYSQTRGKQFFADVRQRVAELPGVESVSLTSELPLLGSTAESVQYEDGRRKITVPRTIVDTKYFGTFGLPILSGRAFNAFDQEGGAEAVVINQKLATMIWPGLDPLGRTITVGEPARKMTIIGIAADARNSSLSEAPGPHLYYALARHYQENITVVARTKGNPRLWMEPVSKLLRSMNVPTPFPPFTFDNWVNLTLLVERITAVCITALSGLGMLLAVVGLFGVVSWSVSERKKELGIRVALGAQPSQLLKMILRQTLLVAGAGVALGILLGVAVTALVRSELYGIGAVEWVVLLTVTVLMLSVSLTIASLSARPWITISPMEVVRHA